MNDDITAILILIAIIVGIVAFFRFGKSMRQKYYAKTANDSYRKRVLGRSIVATMYLGWGFIGTEGFGLPAPVLPSLFFGLLHDVFAPSYIGSLLLVNIVAFAVCWGIALIYFTIKERPTD